MSSDQDIEKTALEKLRKLIENDTIVVFSNEEARALQQFAQIVLALKTFGSLGLVVRSVLVWIGIIIALVLALKSGHILDFFTSQGNSP